LIIQIPLLVALVTGDLLSGEAAMGTIRLIATRPISRYSIVMAKFFAGATSTFVLLLFLGLISLGLGLWFFGPGDLIVLKSEELIIIQGTDTLWRFFCAFGIAFISLTVVATFSLALSCFADNSIGPIISTMAVIILFTIIGTMDIPLFDKIKPFLFTTHMVIWRNFFDNPLPVEQIRNSVIILFVHIVVFLSITLIAFKRKDILS
jgi:ABC-2 type transport system permease protein